MTTRRRFISIAAGAAVAGAFPLVATASARHWTGNALGARTSITIAGEDEARTAQLIAAARSEIERMEQLFSLYRDDSSLRLLNESGRLFHPDADFLRLLSLSSALHGTTDGLFDPTVQPLWDALAAGDDTSAALELVGWQKVRFETGEVQLTKPGMALTFNGIAQGYATDRVADLLRKAGLKNVLVSVGEIAALGQRAPGEDWQVGISTREDGDAEERIALRDAAIATTAPKGTVLDREGKVGHILHPQKGSAPSRWQRISVIHSSAAIADGLSTAMALMDETGMHKAAQAYPGCRIIARGMDGSNLTFTA